MLAFSETCCSTSRFNCFRNYNVIAPNSRLTVNPMPEVAFFCRMLLAVIVTGCIGETRVVRTDADFCPFFFCTSIIYIGEAFAIIEHLITNRSNVITDHYAGEAVAI